MNWFDIVLIVVGVISLTLGLKVGVFRAVFMVGGSIVGLLLAAQISGPLADLLTDSVGSDSIATVIAYTVVLISVMVTAQVLGGILRRIAKLLLLGWADSLAGAALGAVAGVLAGMGIVAVVARLAFLVPEDIPGVGDIVEVRADIEKALVGSTLVPYYVDATDALPANALGLIPADFKSALDELDRRIEAKELEEASTGS